MKIPEGMTEGEVLATIDRVVNVLAPTFKFGFYDAEDIAQEGRLIALDRLEHYDPSRGCSLYSFLHTCVRNRLINLKRDKLSRNISPCASCDCFDDKSCIDFDDHTECERWKKWYAINTSKRNLVEPFDASDIRNETEMAEDSQDFVDALTKKDIVVLIDRYLPVALRGDYLRWKEGSKLPKHRKIKVIEEITNIVKQHYTEVDNG
jgi:DNA-directed RNA polymerase specialized sigma24 family protein